MVEPHPPAHCPCWSWTTRSPPSPSWPTCSAQDERIGAIRTASNGPDALRLLRRDATVDVVFCDIAMPGLDGHRPGPGAGPVRQPRPQVVFVTAYDEHAVDAFDLQATDYVMKPVRAERLREAVRRVVEARDGRAADARGDRGRDDRGRAGGVTRFVQRSPVRYVEAHGDYARLHTAAELHLLRIPLSHARGALGHSGFRPDPPQHAGRPAARGRGALGRRPVQRPARRRRAPGQPPAHPRAARPAGPLGLAWRPVTRGGASARAPNRPRRVRVTSPRTGAARRAPSSRPATREIDEQTGLGEVYMRSLLRSPAPAGAQRARPRPWCCSAACRCCSRLVPSVADAHLLGLPLPWLLLGVAGLPVLWLAARFYVRQAERNEAEFTDVLERH